MTELQIEDHILTEADFTPAVMARITADIEEQLRVEKLSNAELVNEVLCDNRTYESVYDCFAVQEMMDRLDPGWFRRALPDEDDDWRPMSESAVGALGDRGKSPPEPESHNERSPPADSAPDEPRSIG